MNAETGACTPNDVLSRTSRGEATFPELAAHLKGLESMILIMSPADFTRFMHDLTTATKERERKVAAGELPPSEIHVKVTDVDTPRPNGILTDKGFVPRVFTDDRIARGFAVKSGLIEPEAALPLTTKDWVSGLQEFLIDGCAGIVIDDGSDHKINMDRIVLSRVYAYMTFEEFARLPSLHALTYQGKLHLQPASNGGHQAFVYDNLNAVSFGLKELRKTAPEFATQVAATPQLLSHLLHAGVSVLLVNHAVPDARLYNRDDLVQMVDLLRPSTAAESREPAVPPPAPVDPALAPQGETGGGATGEARNDLPGPLQRALARAPLPMVRPPEQKDVDAQMLFHELKKEADRKSIEMFQLIEALAFRIKLYVLTHPRPVDGLTWPQFFRSPDDENQTITYLFTSEDATRKVLENDPPELQRYQPLSGIEALRWIWSAPKNIDNVAIDYYPNSPAWLSFPSYWALSAVFPIFYEIPDLKKVPSTGLAHLGGLPGARGLKPEVVRSLVFGWKQLLGLDGAETTVVHHGSRYLPIFSSADQFLAFTSSPNGIAGKPKSQTGKEAPFAGWLEATVDWDGVLLDPAGPHPLPLEHTDLLALDLWSRRSGCGPTGAEAVAAITRLYYEKKIPAALAGRMVADYPRYWVGLAQAPDGGGSLLMVPGTNACALFTSQDLARQYLDFHMNLPNAVAQIEGMHPSPSSHAGTPRRWPSRRVSSPRYASTPTRTAPAVSFSVATLSMPPWPGSTISSSPAFPVSWRRLDFEKARDKVPALIFIDEVEAVLGRRSGAASGGDHARNSVVATFLA